MYKALVGFTDLQDNNHKYHAGDTFPRRGLKVSEARLNELLTSNNRRNMPIIEEVEESKKVEKKTEKKATKNVKRTTTRNK